jgi:hypothetical protein
MNRKHLLESLAVLHHFTEFFFGGTIGAAIIGVLLFTPLFWVSLLYLTWLYYDFDTPSRGGRRQEWMRRGLLWNWFRDYFPVRLIKTADLNPQHKYIIGSHPHGIICMGAWAVSFSAVFNSTGQSTFSRFRLSVLKPVILVDFSRVFEITS